MDYVILGRTGLSVSVMGLGCGGHSRLGMKRGGTETTAKAVVRRALDLGVNLFDTAQTYGTEPIVGEVIQNVKRDSVHLATKYRMWHKTDAEITGASLREELERSLIALRTDVIDIYNLHALQLDKYSMAMDRLMPEMIKLREEGKIRFFGVTEPFGGDLSHTMLSHAMDDDCWDVIMIGFNLLNPSARRTVFQKSIEKNIGVLVMYAVREALSKPDRLKATFDGLLQRNEITPDMIDINNPLGFLLEDGVADSLTEAAYRFCRHEPGTHVILSGTGNLEHLESNAAAILSEPLPDNILQKLDELFGHVASVSSN